MILVYDSTVVPHASLRMAFLPARFDMDQQRKYLDAFHLLISPTRPRPVAPMLEAEGVLPMGLTKVTMPKRI